MLMMWLLEDYTQGMLAPCLGMLLMTYVVRCVMLKNKSISYLFFECGGLCASINCSGESASAEIYGMVLTGTLDTPEKKEMQVCSKVSK